jgi:octaprenyl-diphosphate synthase
MPDQKQLVLPFNLVKRHLRSVESRITQQAEQFDPEVREYLSYILHTSGKRLRPALVLLTGGATGGIDPHHLNLAVIIELIHLATLVHDDIIDEAGTRRGQPTPNAKWGNATTVLLGDSLFSHALRLSTRFDDSDVCRRIADATCDVCGGEIIQTKRRGDWSVTHQEYSRIIEMKTGSLFIIASELSARLNKADEARVEACAEYGRKLGAAYQIYDDCLDMAGTEETAGKTLRTDLYKGKLTLPLLKLLETSNDIEHAQIVRLLEDSTPESVAELVRRTVRGGHVKAAIQEAADLVNEAQQKISVLEDSDYSQAMRNIGETLLQMLDKLER